jgi:hypothetical protein
VNPTVLPINAETAVRTTITTLTLTLTGSSVMVTAVGMVLVVLVGLQHLASMGQSATTIPTMVRSMWMMMMPLPAVGQTRRKMWQV